MCQMSNVLKKYSHRVLCKNRQVYNRMKMNIRAVSFLGENNVHNNDAPTRLDNI